MVRHIAVIFALVCSIVAGTTAAEAERRLALLIGINDYENIPRLEKAVGDVNAMERKLKALGFDVTKVINPETQESDYRYNALGLLYEKETVDGGKCKYMYNRSGLLGCTPALIIFLNMSLGLEVFPHKCFRSRLFDSSV